MLNLQVRRVRVAVVGQVGNAVAVLIKECKGLLAWSVLGIIVTRVQRCAEPLSLDGPQLLSGRSCSC